MSIENYATLEEAKQRRGLSQADISQDDLLTQLLEVASRKVDAHCNVPNGFFKAQSQTRSYVAKDTRCLQVDFLTAITSIQVDAGYNRSYSSTWSTADYDLYPYNATVNGESYWEIRTRASATAVFPVDEYEPRVRVTATFGRRADVPAEVREATLLLVSRFKTREDSPFGVVGSGEIGTYRISPIDPDVKSLLEPFRERVAW